MLGLTLCACAAVPARADRPLEPMLWKYRVVLIDAGRLAVDSSQSDVVQWLLNEQANIDERDIRWIVLGADRDESPIDDLPDQSADRRAGDAADGHASDIQSNASEPYTASFSRAVRRTYFSRGDHAVVLVGKDGGVKAVDDRLDLKSLFGLIDGMPMRQREMQQR